MKRSYYFISLIIDIIAYLILIVATTNFLILGISYFASSLDYLITKDSFIGKFFPYFKLMIYIGYVYFYFIFVPYKNKQGTLGDVFVNLRLTKINNKKITQFFLIKRLFLAFIGNSLFFASFIYSFFKKSNGQTLHDNIMKSKYEHVRVTSIKKDKKTKKK